MTANDGKAADVVILDVREVSTITDYFVVITGSSLNHLRGLGKRIEDQLKESGQKPDHVDGYQSAGWLVLDFGSVIIHMMLAETRAYYNLERLWGDAPLVNWE